MKKTTTAIAAFSLALSAIALPTVQVNSVVQRWPWNNKVDITYTVENVETLVDGGYYRVVFTATIPGRAEPIVIDGSSDIIAKAVAGTHTVTWTPPEGVFGTGCTMNVDLYESTGDYMIVDLDTGNYAFEDLRATQAESNARYNTDQNKGERLVLRKVAKTSESAYPDGYPTGNNASYGSTNSETTWTTTKDYFIGIFELTSSQYDRIFGTASSSYRPKATVKWHVLRGVGNTASSTSSVTPSATGSGVFQRLCAKTGLYFDMPTELMWEIACRAGEAKLYPWGADDNTNLGDYAWYKANSSSAQPVGGKLPNNWGLFDMLGNVQEMCRDGNSQSNLSGASDVFTPAANPSGDYERRIRGFAYNSSSADPSSRSLVNHYPPTFYAQPYQGCRAALYIK